MSKVTLEEIVSLCKRRGFIYQGSEIYGGLAGTYDYGPLGTLLKRNIVNEWLKFFVDGWDDMYQIDSAILMNPKVWQASGHTETFSDPLVECSNCHIRVRADHLIDDAIKINNSSSNPNIYEKPTGTLENIKANLGALKPKCPNCGKTGTFSEARQFNMMFRTNVGPTEDENSVAYLRPETAQGMFTNFKNIVDSFYPDIPFGIAQIGRNFRNEISPRDFIFRVREFEIMEFEYFVQPDKWEESFEKWRKDMHSWFKLIGLPADKIHEIEVPVEDRAHYSERTIDFEFDYPFGVKEIAGLAYRTDFDLTNHQKHSGKNLEYRPKDGSAAFVPHVIEPTFGLDRHILAVLANAYTEDEQNGEKRVYLKLPKNLAPIKVAVSPLAKNKPELVAKAREIYGMLRKGDSNASGLRSASEVAWIDTGNVGKNYRRADEIGIPSCITVDFDTLEDDSVTVRDRDTTEQKRVKISNLINAT